MTRVGGDSVTLLNIPPDVGVVFYYVDGWYAQPRWQVDTHWPGALKVGIAVHPWTNAGDVLDIEEGDASPGDFPGWRAMRLAAGHPNPAAYFSDAIAPQIPGDVPRWRAAYPGIGPVIYPGDIAHQWVDHGPWDESVVADVWPGLDGASPSPDLTEAEVQEIMAALADIKAWQGKIEAETNAEIQDVKHWEGVILKALNAIETHLGIPVTTS